MQIINPSPSAIYTGISNAFSTIARVEGTQSLWRGVSSVILGAGTREAKMGENSRSENKHRAGARNLLRNLRGGKKCNGWKQFDRAPSIGCRYIYDFPSSDRKSDAENSHERGLRNDRKRCAHESIRWYDPTKNWR